MRAVAVKTLGKRSATTSASPAAAHGTPSSSFLCLAPIIAKSSRLVPLPPVLLCDSASTISRCDSSGLWPTDDFDGSSAESELVEDLCPVLEISHPSRALEVLG